jgi:hypothetical protein
MASAQYPANVRNFGSDVVDFTTTVLAEHVNFLRAEVSAVETTIGNLPLTSSGWVGAFDQSTTTWNTIRDRIANIEYGVHSAYTAMVPTGGTTGQVLVKNSGSDYDFSWTTGNFLPSQLTQSGKFLTTNGSTASWASINQFTAPTIGSTSIGSGATVTTISGLNLTSGTVTADPTTALGIVSKQYVDAIADGINTHNSVAVATTGLLSGTYTNGSSGADGGTGVGAIFTMTALGALVIDGVTVSTVGTRVLVKDQTTQTQNGIYTLTTAGATGVSAILTRATDYDNSIPGEVNAGDIVFCVGGTVNGGQGFIMNTYGTATSPAKGIKIGTDNIVFAQFSLPPQSTNSGKFLTTNGTIASWASAITGVTAGTGLTGGGTSGSVTVNLDTTSAYVVPSQSGNSGKYLTTNGSTASWSTVSVSGETFNPLLLIGA